MMKRFTTRLRPLLAALTLAAASNFAMALTASAGVFYECDMNTKIQNGWISPKIGIVINDAGQVTVIDAVVLQFIGDPVKAKVSRRGDKLRITWNIANAVDSQGERAPKFRYVADLNSKTMAIAVSAKPVGYTERWYKKGKCKTRAQ